MDKEFLPDNLITMIRDWMLCAICTIFIGTAVDIDPLICWFHGLMVGCMFAWAIMIAWIWSHFSIKQLDKELEEIEKENKESN